MLERMLQTDSFGYSNLMYVEKHKKLNDDWGCAVPNILGFRENERKKAGQIWNYMK